MADRGIIFSAAMVRALLDGRKTQTRRLATSPLRRCEVDDRLWVRENWQMLRFGDYVPTKSLPADFRYAATEPLADLPIDARGYPWRPSIHMIRAASRLTLIVTDVRFQHLQEISHSDAVAEGIDLKPLNKITSENGWRLGRHNSPREFFASLWDSLHDKPGERWSDNPQLVALSFSVQHGNIDQLPNGEGQGL